MTRPDSEYLRGSVWAYDFEPGAVPKPAVIVSSNGRNRSRWPVVHVVRVTSAPKTPRDTIVELDPADMPLRGRVICDDLTPAFKAELGDRLGSLTPATMRRIDTALKLVLGLT